MEARPADYVPPPSKKGGPVIEFRDALGRRRFRNAQRRNSEMRKVVPKRKFDLKTAEGWIKKYGYQTDTTRKEFAEALGTSRFYIDKVLAAPNAKNKTKLRPFHIETFAKCMALTQEQKDKIYVAYNEGPSSNRERVLVKTTRKQSPRRNAG